MLSILIFLLTSFTYQTIKSDEISIENHEVKNETSSLPTSHFDYSSTVLTKDYQRSSHEYFSSADTFDEVTLYISKGQITQTRVTIRIHNSNKELIYQHVFPTTQLIYGYDLTEIHSDEQMEDKIIEWANRIVDQGFINPNMLSEDDYLNRANKDDFLDFDTFKEIKNSNRRMFHYVLGEEEHFYLGFSQKIKKVVQLISCC